MSDIDVKPDVDVEPLPTDDSVLTAEEKYEKLPEDKKQEVDALVLSIAAQNMAEIQTIQEEKDVYYDTKNQILSYIPLTDDKPTDPNLVRLGTIGPAASLDNLNGVITHKNEKGVPVYEVDDGEDNFDRIALKAAGYKIKRSFIDASVYDGEGLLIYLQNKAIEDQWYKAQTDNLIDILHEETKTGVDVKTLPVEK